MRKINEKNKMLLQLKNRIGRLKFIWPMNPALFGILLFTVMIVVGSLPVPAYADTIRLGGMKLLAEEFKKSQPGDTVIIFPSMGSAAGSRRCSPERLTSA